MKTIAQGIFDGQIGVEGGAGLRNPWVKLLALVTPMILILYQHLARAQGWGRLENYELVICAGFLFICASLDLSARGLAPFVRRAFVWLVFVSLLTYLLIEPTGVWATFLGFMTRTYALVPVLNTISAESWIVVLLVVVMLVAVQNITTRDALFIGRRLLWRGAFHAYALFIVTYATIHSALPLRIAVAWRVANDKSTLLKNAHLPKPMSWPGRMVHLLWIFAYTIIGSLAKLASSIETLAYQRGLFRRGYKDHLAGAWSVEDAVSSMVFVLGLFVLVMFRGVVGAA